MVLRAALDGKVLVGQFTGFTTATATIPIPGNLIGKFDPTSSTVMASVFDADAGTPNWGYRISSFTRSQVVIVFVSTLAAADRVHVMIAG